MSNLLVIDNTRSAGNFFDELLNYNMLVTEYDIDNIKSISLDKDDNIIIDTYLSFEEDPRYNHMEKYDYINEYTFETYKNDEYEQLFKAKYKKMFSLTKSQYKQYYDFVKEHKSCLSDNKDGRLILEYHIKNNEDSLLVFDKFVKCNICNDTVELINKPKENKSDEFDKEFLDSYNLFSKYRNLFSKIEFYRFMEIYNEYKDEEIIVSFEETGIGSSIYVRTNEYIYNITDIDCW